MTPPLLSRTHVVLVRPQGPVNVGLACRAAANMGAASVRLVAPGKQALRADLTRPFACHASDLLAQIAPYDSLADALADTDFALATSRRIRRGPQTFVDERQGAARIAACPRASAVVFGSEADGLNTAEIEACNATLALDLPGPYPSMNLSHAVAVVLWGLHQTTPRLPPQNREGAATGTQRRALFQLWEAALDETGYFLRAGRGRFLSKLQALSENVAVTGRDVQLMAGMLKHWRRQAVGRADAPQKAPRAIATDATGAGQP